MRSSSSSSAPPPRDGASAGGTSQVADAVRVPVGRAIRAMLEVRRSSSDANAGSARVGFETGEEKADMTGAETEGGEGLWVMYRA